MLGRARPSSAEEGTRLANIAYLVHDLADAAVARRVRMLRTGGATVSLAGFHRREAPPSVEEVLAVNLGQTADARLKQRVAAVARHLLRPASAKRAVRDADTVIARNLEALGIAVRVAAPGQRIVYECLDIHRLLTADGAAGALMRALERRLLNRAALVLTSSPAFEREYFVGRQHYRIPIRIEENKVFALDNSLERRVASRLSKGPPWRIGWFGMLRCRRSLAVLRRLVREANGRVEAVVAGVPSLVEFDDFHRDVADTPGLSYLGPYTAADLARLYGDVHFAWAIDYFEEGQNSAWLLPNRLYESLAHGTVPIALAGVETGRWLAAQGAGLLLDDPAADLGAVFASLDRDRFAALAAAVARVPESAVTTTRADCVALTRAVLGEAA